MLCSRYSDKNFEGARHEDSLHGTLQITHYSIITDGYNPEINEVGFVGLKMAAAMMSLQAVLILSKVCNSFTSIATRNDKHLQTRAVLEVHSMPHSNIQYSGAI